jgi:formylglycine-generating enzyme required for sulfatase activity
VNSTLKDNKEIVSAGQRVARGLITGKSTEEIFSDFREDKVGIDMIFVEGGTFLMGCTSEQGTDCEDNERPVHSVTVSDFYIGKYPITQKQWKKVMGNNPSFDKGDDLPVQKISWYDAQTFIKELNTITGKKYRLPTEAEWEYAARGGVKSNGHKYSGSSLIDKVAWYIVNSGDKTLDDGYMDSLLSTYNADRFLQILKSNKNITHPVGTKQPNELSIYDMSGNGEEWVEDKYGNYSPSPQINPIGLSSSGRVVIRGCAVASNAKDCRVSKRFGIFPVDSANGFRLAMSAKIVEVYTTKKVEDDIMKSAEEFI